MYIMTECSHHRYIYTFTIEAYLNIICLYTIIHMPATSVYISPFDMATTIIWTYACVS